MRTRLPSTPATVTARACTVAALGSYTQTSVLPPDSRSALVGKPIKAGPATTPSSRAYTVAPKAGAVSPFRVVSDAVGRVGDHQVRPHPTQHRRHYARVGAVPADHPVVAEQPDLAELDLRVRWGLKHCVRVPAGGRALARELVQELVHVLVGEPDAGEGIRARVAQVLEQGFLALAEPVHHIRHRLVPDEIGLSMRRRS